MKRPSIEQRKMLGSFLASKRARVQPGDLGLPAGLRRTPGLRREEVAFLAGVSVSWYTWLEQGRDIQASLDTLRRVSQALKLDRTEFAHLCALSSRGMPSIATDEQLTSGLDLFVQCINPVPACVWNTRFDVLAWNPALSNLFIDYDALKPHERNALRLLFLHASFRTLILDWEQTARGMLSAFRASRAKADDQAPFDDLIQVLTSTSPEFREWWPDVDVNGFDEGAMRLRHPTMGRIDLTYIAFSPEGKPDLSLMSYILPPKADVSPA